MVALCVVLLGVTGSFPASWRQESAPRSPAPASQEPGTKPSGEALKKSMVLDPAVLDKQFQESMSGVVLIGQYTIVGDDAGENAPARKDRYTIQKVTKLANDMWLFQARIQYGNRDVTVPLPLQVKWAGDTPVITVTDLTIPGLGTYTARVLFYRGQYAGTWSGGDHGGHLWGRIDKLPAESPKQDPTKQAPPAKQAPPEPGTPLTPRPDSEAARR